MKIPPIDQERLLLGDDFVSLNESETCEIKVIPRTSTQPSAEEVVEHICGLALVGGIPLIRMDAECTSLADRHGKVVFSLATLPVGSTWQFEALDETQVVIDKSIQQSNSSYNSNILKSHEIKRQGQDEYLIDGNSYLSGCLEICEEPNEGKEAVRLECPEESVDFANPIRRLSLSILEEPITQQLSVDDPRVGET